MLSSSNCFLSSSSLRFVPVATPGCWSHGSRDPKTVFPSEFCEINQFWYDLILTPKPFREKWFFSKIALFPWCEFIFLLLNWAIMWLMETQLEEQTTKMFAKRSNCHHTSVHASRNQGNILSLKEGLECFLEYSKPGGLPDLTCPHQAKCCLFILNSFLYTKHPYHQTQQLFWGNPEM